MNEIRKLIRAIQAYRIRAETTGQHVKPNGEFTTDYNDSHPLILCLQSIAQGNLGFEVEKWNSLSDSIGQGRYAGSGPSNITEVKR